MKKWTALILFIVFALTVGITGTIGIVDAAKNKDLTYWVCVDEDGNMRLETGKKVKCEKSEKKIELPSIQLISLLEEKIGELEDRITEMETPVSNFTITSTAGSDGSISPSSAVTVDQGGDLTFTITADTGYHIADVLVDGLSVGALSTYTFPAVTTDHTIAAFFEIDGTVPEDLIITSTAGSDGSISPSGAVTVDQEGDLTFTITADTGYHIADVLVDGLSVGALSTYTFPAVTTDHTIAAFFEIDGTGDIIQKDLVLYLPLYEYELDGDTIISRDAYGHTCTVTGALWKPDGCQFDGSDDDIAIPNHTALQITSAITIEAWVKILGAHKSGYGALWWDGRDSVRNRLMIGDNGSLLVEFITVNGTNNFETAGAGSIASDTWTHIVLTYNGSEIVGWIDAAKKTPDAATGNIRGSTATRYIGKGTTASYNLNGLIGEFRVYNRALTPSEIQHNYEATKWRYE